MESPPKRRKISQSGGSRLTASALEAAASSTGTSRPSTFVLETEELLQEVKLDYGSKSLQGIDDFLFKLKATIEAGIRPHGPVPIHDASSKCPGVVLPFPDPQPPADSQLKLSLETPAKINVVGSYVSKTMVKPQAKGSNQGDGESSVGNSYLTVDMVVEMSRSMFQEKDYLNMRYFYKRAYFLAHLAGCVSSPKADLPTRGETKIEPMNGNPLIPVLVLQPSFESHVETSAGRAHRSVDVRVRVIPCAPEGLFPSGKLSPAKNCIRPADAENKKQDTSSLPPTPFYNSTLKAESLYLTYLKELRRAEKVAPAFKDACVLGRVWLQQRGFGGSVSRGGFGHFEWALLLALLLQGGGRKGQPALSPALGSHQLFKATIQVLAKSDFVQKHLLLGKTSTDGAAGADDAREAGAPVLYDAARHLNFAFKMSPWSAALLRKYAKWSLDVFTDNSVDQFRPSFIAKADVPLQLFDLAVVIPCPTPGKAATKASAGTPGLSYNFASRVYRTVTRALGNRAEHISIQLPSECAWTASERKPIPEDETLLVGVIFHPTEMARPVDHGPPAEEKAEAQKFRQFWGEKAELRRFADGTIVETLLWSKDTAFGVCREIIRYILNLHLKVDEDELEFFGNGFAPLISAKPSDAAAYSGAREAFATLERDIRALEDLPLRVRQLAPTAPELRSASVKPPVLNSPRSPYTPMDVVIFFEASGKWPENLAAIQHTKVAFLLEIAKLLEAAHAGSLTTHIGQDGARHHDENLAFLDIVYEDTGAVFRLRVHSDHEETLLDKQTKDKTVEQHQRAESASLLSTCRRLYSVLPLHNQTITTFCTRFPALSPTIRLVKRWFAAHMLANHVPPEAIELMVLQAFTSPGTSPWRTAPSSPGVGLLRTLHFLAGWDWRYEPLVVDPSDEMDAVARAAVETRFNAWRKTLDPAMHRTVLVVATPADATGTAFTTVNGAAQPRLVAATRMTDLARACCRLVREAGVELDPRSLFVAKLDHFDVVIRLDKTALKAVIANGDGSSKSRYKNLDGSTERVPVARDPARVVLDELARVYGDVLVFFLGTGGISSEGMIIGAVWNPAYAKRKFAPSLPCVYKPVVPGAATIARDDFVDVDRDAIVHEIARIGGELFEKVEVKGPK